jgi:hypothetical protein
MSLLVLDKKKEKGQKRLHIFILERDISSSENASGRPEDVSN